MTNPILGFRSFLGQFRVDSSFEFRTSSFHTIPAASACATLTSRDSRPYFPVLYLLLKVASSVGMGLVLKRADARSLDRLPLIRANYAVAAVLGFIATVALGQNHISTPTMLLAAITGVLFVAGLLVWTRAIQAAGLALSVVAMRTAVVIPLLASVIIWHERPSPLELAGSVVALLALALVLSEVARPKLAKSESLAADRRPPSATADCKLQTGNSRAARGHSSSALHSSLFWLSLLFLTEGLVMVPALVFRKQLPPAENMPFQTVIFITAFFVTTLLYYLRKPRLTRETLQWGALLGTANLGNYLFLVLALSVLPGLAVYPAIAAGEVGLMAVAGVVLWKEKVGVRSWLGIALAVLALVLIQFGKTAG
jgi:drug/metabolite transporter (DMT)-like permease